MIVTSRKLTHLQKCKNFLDTYRCLKKNLLSPPQKHLSSFISSVNIKSIYALKFTKKDTTQSK